MPYIGLTGVFGSGKSSVLRVFQSLGALVIDADAVVRRITDSDPAVRREIGRRLGPSVMDADGGIDRRSVADIIFSDDRKRADLEALLHPYVFAEAERVRQQAFREDRNRMVILEAPLLFETGYDRMMDATIVVTCPLDRILERMEARQISRAEVLRRLRSQLGQEEKARKADYCIDNGGSPEDTARQVQNIHRKILDSLPDPSG